MDVASYLRRIGYKGQLAPDIHCLKQLHRSHVMHIPFEALDVHYNTSISLDQKEIFNKVIIQKRGGYCYELNHLFHLLLIQIGFKSVMISSRIYSEDLLGPEFDHMSIIVQLEDIWLVDVGYGDLFLEPIRLAEGIVQEDQYKNYRIEAIKPNRYLLSESKKGHLDFIKRYSFDLQPRVIEEFYDQNIVKQTSPDSYFVKNMICTQPTENGRKTIFNDNYKVREGNHVYNNPIEGKDALSKLLLNEFSITISK